MSASSRVLCTDFNSDKFRDYLATNKIKLSKLATLVDYSSSTLSHWSNGNKLPSEKAVEKICSVLGVHNKFFCVDRLPDAPIVGSYPKQVENFDPKKLGYAMSKAHMHIGELSEASGIPERRIAYLMRVDSGAKINEQEIHDLTSALGIDQNELLKDPINDRRTRLIDIRKGDIYLVRLDNGATRYTLVLNRINDNCFSGLYLNEERRHANWIEVFADKPMYVDAGKVGVLLVSRIQSFINQVPEEVFGKIQKELMDTLGFHHEVEIDDQVNEVEEKPEPVYLPIFHTTMAFHDVESWNELCGMLLKFPFPDSAVQVHIEMYKEGFR